MTVKEILVTGILDTKEKNQVLADRVRAAG